MTEAEWDLVFALKEKIETATKFVTSQILQGQPREIDDEVRQLLTENFRFWR